MKRGKDEVDDDDDAPDDSKKHKTTEEQKTKPHFIQAIIDHCNKQGFVCPHTYEILSLASMPDTKWFPHVSQQVKQENHFDSTMRDSGTDGIVTMPSGKMHGVQVKSTKHDNYHVDLALYNSLRRQREDTGKMYLLTNAKTVTWCTPSNNFPEHMVNIVVLLAKTVRQVLSLLGVVDEAVLNLPIKTHVVQSSAARDAKENGGEDAYLIGLSKLKVGELELEHSCDHITSRPNITPMTLEEYIAVGTTPEIETITMTDIEDEKVFEEDAKVVTTSNKIRFRQTQMFILQAFMTLMALPVVVLKGAGGIGKTLVSHYIGDLYYASKGEKSINIFATPSNDVLAQHIKLAKAQGKKFAVVSGEKLLKTVSYPENIYTKAHLLELVKANEIIFTTFDSAARLHNLLDTPEITINFLVIDECDQMQHRKYSKIDAGRDVLRRLQPTKTLKMSATPSCAPNITVPAEMSVAEGSTVPCKIIVHFSKEEYNFTTEKGAQQIVDDVEGEGFTFVCCNRKKDAKAINIKGAAMVTGDTTFKERNAIINSTAKFVKVVRAWTIGFDGPIENIVLVAPRYDRSLFQTIMRALRNFYGRISKFAVVHIYIFNASDTSALKMQCEDVTMLKDLYNKLSKNITFIVAETSAATTKDTAVEFGENMLSVINGSKKILKDGQIVDAGVDGVDPEWCKAFAAWFAMHPAKMPSQKSKDQ